MTPTSPGTQPGTQAGTHCVIGAGFAGLGAARALRDRGVDVDVVEARHDVGGNWLDGVYDSTHLITSRASTGFAEHPMPATLPDFPHWTDLLAYLRDYAERFDLRRHIAFDTEVTAVEPAGRADGTDGWLVTTQHAGRTATRHYAGVVVANGHHWDPFVPQRPGHFTGRQLHVKDYKRPADLHGERVLVVGGGVSGCDLAVEAARAVGHADLSMRRSHHFLPKTLFGTPITDLNNPWMPVAVQRLVTGSALRLIHGPLTKYGLPEPEHRLFDEQVTIHSQVLYALRHGQVSPRPDIERFDGSTVHFSDGTAADYDTVIWATGYAVSFPFLDDDLFTWEHGVPRRVLGMLPEQAAGLYVFGLMQLRGGAGPMLSRSAELLADLVELQAGAPRPVARDLARLRPADARFYVSVPAMTRQVALERAAVGALRRVQRVRGTQAPAASAAVGAPTTVPRPAPLPAPVAG
ncbi:flavin-containing monooxygenase [Actinomycetospora aeridis]|uniref:NAD(P)-binding domain-containing protein n=1 Tax=Actinomycetospora aeridis TaxID=3129231 RepID=A0ABU8N982_9PSEU